MATTKVEEEAGKGGLVSEKESDGCFGRSFIGFFLFLNELVDVIADSELPCRFENPVIDL